MSCITSTCSQNLTLDPYKHVCYSQGLVLGVDEFVQEEIYFLGQHRWQNRGLHGYGTVCGLEVRVTDSATRGPQISVMPGMALDPIGHRIRVGAEQCAYLNEWLARFGDTLSTSPGPDGAELFLRLCFRECATDTVPIPGGPCRSSDETAAPSRVLDDFCLKLTTTPPDQTEANVVRAFGRLLRQIHFTDAEPPTLLLEEFEAKVRALGSGSPDVMPVFSPNESPFLGWRVATSDAELFLHTGFRIWVTEVRPALLPDGRNCAGGPPDGDCILLARLQFPITTGATGLVVNGAAADVTIDETSRPYLLHTQLIQELIPGHSSGQGTRDHSLLLNLENDDHAQYLLVDPADRALVDDLDADAHRVLNLLNGVNPGDAMPIGQGAAGDLAGTYPNPTVARIQSFDVRFQQPTDAQVLTWEHTGPGANDGEWVPKPIPAGNPGTNAEENLVRIAALSWTHSQNHDLTFTLDGRRTFGVAVAFSGEIRMTSGSRPLGHRLDLGSLDEHSFQVLAEFPDLDPGLARLLRRQRIAPFAVLPIDPTITGGRITSGTSPAGVPVNGIVNAKAAFLQLDNDDVLPGILKKLGDVRIYVEISGDHVLAADGRAIDAEFDRAELPTGDRPNGGKFGVQGGFFRSWFRHGKQGRIALPVNVNRATFADLIEIGLPENFAAGIIELHGTLPNGFTALNELGRAKGSTPELLRKFANTRTFNLR